MNAPNPSKTANTRRLIALAVVGVLLLAVAGLVLTKHPSPPPEALPVAPQSEETGLPLPSTTEIAKNYGGLAGNTTQQSLVTRVGNHIAAKSEAAKSGLAFRFFVLADEKRINVFATPDGTVFITSLLLNHLKTEGQLASMLSHAIAQVTLKQQPKYLAAGLFTYSSEQEDMADAQGVRFMSQAGYDPTSYIATLMALRDLNAQYLIEFFQTHPSPVNRVAHIEFAIKQQFPDGVPDALSK